LGDSSEEEEEEEVLKIEPKKPNMLEELLRKKCTGIWV
jgi:hypothetical protein